VGRTRVRAIRARRRTGARAHGRTGPDPADYYQPAEVAGLLDGDWTVLADETRPRTVPGPPGTHHTHDTVLRARRLR
ncbi:hypothetical protein AB0C60_10960, partial [Streptomyces sp. NPDC048845]